MSIDLVYSVRLMDSRAGFLGSTLEEFCLTAFKQLISEREMKTFRHLKMLFKFLILSRIENFLQQIQFNINIVQSKCFHCVKQSQTSCYSIYIQFKHLR